MYQQFSLLLVWKITMANCNVTNVKQSLNTKELLMLAFFQYFERKLFAILRNFFTSKKPVWKSNMFNLYIWVSTEIKQNWFSELCEHSIKDISKVRLTPSSFAFSPWGFIHAWFSICSKVTGYGPKNSSLGYDGQIKFQDETNRFGKDFKLSIITNTFHFVSEDFRHWKQISGQDIPVVHLYCH